MSRITHNPRATALIGSALALVICTAWLLDAAAQDRRRPIPEKPRQAAVSYTHLALPTILLV